MANPPVGPTLQIYAGDDFSQQFNFTTDTGSAYALTGTWRAQFRPDPTSNISVPFTVNTASMASGQITISMTGAVTATLNSVSGTWDLEQTAGGVVKTWLVGPVVWTQDVSR